MTERYPVDFSEYENAEQRLFKKCLMQAAKGGDMVFPLRIKGHARVPFLPRDDRGPMIVDAAIDFDLPLPIMSDTDGLTVVDYLVTDGDASSVQRRHTFVFAHDGFSLGIDRANSKDVAIPEYLRAAAVRWLETDIETALRATDDGRRMPTIVTSRTMRERATGEDRISVPAIVKNVENELRNITVHVDNIGTSVLARKQDVPSYVLVADPIMGPTHHFGIALSGPSNTGWMYGWMRELLSFPLGDYRQADAIRNELVSRYCPDHEEFGYDWTDARLQDANGLIDHHEELLRLADKEGALELAILEFGKELGRAMPSGSEARHNILAAVRQSPDAGDVMEACSIAQNEHPEVYKTFLEAAGWDFDFDPMDMMELKRQYAMGVPLTCGKIFGQPTPSL